MEQLLKKFKYIEPMQNFKERSLTLILSAPQNPASRNFILEFFRLVPQKAALAASASLVIIILVTFSLLIPKAPIPSLASSLDPQTLHTEANKLDIQIQLSQAKYYEDSLQKVEIALKEAASDTN